GVVLPVWANVGTAHMAVPISSETSFFIIAISSDIRLKHWPPKKLRPIGPALRKNDYQGDLPPYPPESNPGENRGLKTAMKRLALVFVFAAVLIFAAGLRAQHQHGSQQQGPSPAQEEEMAHATTAMSEHHHGHDGHEHSMGPHMKMSALRPANADDTTRAN